MEQNVKFRNHISVIFEQSMKSMGILFFVFVGGILSEIEDIGTFQFGDELWIIVLATIAIFILILLIQWYVWSKTYIFIQDGTIVVERNTLNRKKNTIGIKNVSNVNLQQNLFQMLLQTCRVKLDTNSLSTADQTDISIVLKKQDAIAFRNMILSKEETFEEPSQGVLEAPKKRFTAEIEDIMVHGLYSINVMSVLMVLIVAGMLMGMLGVFGETVAEGMIIIFEMPLVVLWILGMWIWSIAKEFVKYIDFRIERKGNKLFLSYGVLKKVSYSIPVDKINAIRLKQTVFARIGNCYMAEVINVGMDDDENEVHSFLLPFAKRTKIEQQLQMLLPEFSSCLDMETKKQPKCIWKLWVPSVLLVEGFLWVIVWIIGELAGEAMPIPVLLICMAAVFGCMLIGKAGNYLTAGCTAGADVLKVTTGCFGRQSLFMKYDKIQILTGKQNFLAKRLGVQKGLVHILAGMKNRVHNLPYMNEGMFMQIQRKL